MKKILLLAFLLPFIVEAAGGRVQIIPQPVSVIEKSGSFLLDANVQITGDKHLEEWFKGALAHTTGVALRDGGGKRKILLEAGKMADRNRLGAEGYVLTVEASVIRIKANEAAGVFHGLQTLLQLIPAGSKGVVSIPCAEIMDYPRFAWRGLMLDVSRHFFTKDQVKQYIDEMVLYKYNTLHLHLSDDQGWRIEIKSLPMLTQKGAWRVARTGGRWGEFMPALANEPATEGGFYTQEDMRELIKYAQDRYVTILPEIDIPAHSLALIASYPNLSCTQLQYPVNAGFRNPARDDNALCIGNDSIYLTLDKIFTELAALFPSEYIHVGGDEAYKGFWAQCPKCKRRMDDEHLKNVDELQSYFIKRMETMLKAHGKKLIGWDEILEGGLAPEATVMSWRGMKGGIAAAKMGHKVVMTPWDFCYLDLYQGEINNEPSTYGMCRLRDSYTYDPVPDSVDEQLILGGQGNLWSEMVPTLRHAEYMTWPRGLALAEVYWSPKAARNWDDFTKRMENEFVRLDSLDIKYARSSYNVVLSPRRGTGTDRDFVVHMSTEVTGLDIYYTFDNTNPDRHSMKYSGTPVKFPMGAVQLNVITYRNGRPIGQQVIVRKEDLAKRVDQPRHEY